MAKAQKKYVETTKPVMNEIASSEDNLYLKGTIIPYNPDTLLGRKGFPIYDQMRIDDQVKACLTLKKFATLAPNYEIVPASNDEQDIEVADFVQFCLHKMKGSVIDSVLEIMTALDYGYSITEINYKNIESGQYAGKIGLASLKTKQPYYYRFAVDEYSNLLKKGIVYDKGGSENYYPTSKFLVFSYQKEFGNHYGTSDLRPAYRGYWSKDVLIKMWNIYLERFANPTIIGKYKSNDPSGKTSLRNILDNITSKTSITHRIDEYEIGLLESNRASTNDFNTALNFYNKTIARSILIPDRLMAEGETGAYSQAKVHFDVFLWVIQKLRQDIEETVMNEQLIKRLVAYNYSNVEELPKFVFNPMTDDQKIELQNLFVTAVEKGVIVPTLEDENVLRRQLNFPEKDLDVETADTVIEDKADDEVIEEEERTNAYGRDETLKKKVSDHNEKYTASTKRATLGMLKQVYDRGIGAYRTNPGSVRPSVTSAQQWAMARVNSYLRALGSGRYGGGKHDADLFPKGHPLSSKDNAYATIAELDLKPTEAMAKEAERGLAWRKEFNRGGTQVGVTRANQLSNRSNLSPTTVQRMFSFFSRHESDKKAQGFSPGEEGYPSAGRIAWALWGGDSGFSWARVRWNQIKNIRNNALVDELEDLEKKTKVSYTPSKAEKRINFAKVDKHLQKIEDDFESEVRDTLVKQQDAVKTYIKKKIDNGTFNFSAIESVELKFKGQLNKQFKEYYEHAYDDGIKDGKSELPKKFVTSNLGEGLSGGQLLSYLNSKSRQDVKTMLMNIDSRLIPVLVEGLRNGLSSSELALQIDDVFSAWTAGGTMLNPAGKLIKDYNLRTIARTASIGAYNFGKRAVGQDKDLQGFVVGFGLSPVLDSKTSDICRTVARTRPKIKIGDQQTLNRLSPPLHFNCRTILYYLTVDDEPIQFSPSEELGFLNGATKVT